MLHDFPGAQGSQGGVSTGNAVIQCRTFASEKLTGNLMNFSEI
jgi:hypothetical protein